MMRYSLFNRWQLHIVSVCLLYTSNILNIVFPLITNPYLTRILSKSNYGYFNTANTWASFVIPLAAFGIYNYGIRAISKVKDDKNKINYVFSKLFYISVFTSLLTTGIYFLIIFFDTSIENLKVPVSYTHLDVYKRQVLQRYKHHQHHWL